MSKLDKWNPFKFKRSKNRDKDDTSSGNVPVEVRNQTPQSADPMARMFELFSPARFWNDPFAMFGEMDRFFGDFAPRTFSPTVDVTDEGKHLRVSAELPGLDKNDVDVEVQDGILVISGQKKTEDETNEDGCYRLERYFGEFRRSVPLPMDVDTARAEATFDKGVLTVRLPKLPESESRSRKISVG